MFTSKFIFLMRIKFLFNKISFSLIKFVIVHFGSYAFACHWLTLEQWAWCILFGVGTLLWGQVIDKYF